MIPYQESVSKLGKPCSAIVGISGAVLWGYASPDLLHLLARKPFPGNVTPEIAETFNLPVKEGVLITGVLQDGPAGESGMLPGDVVLEVDGKRVLNTSQLLNAVASLKPQSQAAFVIQRGKGKLTLKVTAAQRPKSLAVTKR